MAVPFLYECCTRSGLRFALEVLNYSTFYPYSTVTARRVKPDRRPRILRTKVLRFFKFHVVKVKSSSVSSFIWPSCCFSILSSRRGRHFHLTESRVVRLSYTRQPSLCSNCSLKRCFMLRKMVDLLVSLLMWVRVSCLRSLSERQSIQIDSLTLAFSFRKWKSSAQQKAK